MAEWFGAARGGAPYMEPGGAAQGYAPYQEAGGGIARQALRPCTVSEINRHINALLKSDPLLAGVWVKGEISNFRPHYSGHLYFTLKDGSAAIKCVMFRSAASRLRFAIENGMSVIIGGAISVFERDGQYQLYCEDIASDGLGSLYVAYEQLKNRLEAEGLFDASRKKPIPAMPKAVCLVTSPTGSVVHDMLNVSLRRFPGACIKVFPVQVQGAAAAPQIARAIAAINELALADLIIVARGGGSLEDLWPFNEEITARAVSASAIPTISAVGHETDFTICDFAADLRAPTPSAAAELAFPDIGVICERLAQYSRRLKSGLLKKAERSRARLERCLASQALAKPLIRVEHGRMRVNSAEEKLAAAVRRALDKNRAEVAVLAGRLNALSPLAVLSRGYAVVTRQQGGEVVRDAAMVRAGDRLRVRLRDGGLLCEALEADP
ncbi:MAG: exodeoxyribonuclease VII large subunit [Clostridiales bacterium]|jgi:exodeoxyribonuclease VII large subunit|nr:exodeoxyribonuclease VII large subunit [Clostridiales bacterium]